MTLSGKMIMKITTDELMRHKLTTWLILGLHPCQWETSLQSNAVSHWLGANLDTALNNMLQISISRFLLRWCSPLRQSARPGQNISAHLSKNSVWCHEWRFIDEFWRCRQRHVEGIGVLTPVWQARTVHVVNAFVVVVRPPGGVTKVVETNHLET